MKKMIKSMAGLSALGLMSVATAQQTVRPANSFVQDIRVRGRVQTQFGYVDAKNDEGSSDYSTFEVRRARIGLRANFENDIRAQVEANVVTGDSVSVRSATIQWRGYKPAYVRVGYDKPLSSMEENTSSAEILTVERSLISNTVAAPGETTGILVQGDLGVFYYGAGVFTGQVNTNTDNQSAEYLYNLQAGLKLDGLLGEDSKLRIQGSYLTTSQDGSVLLYEDVYTIGIHFEQGSFDLRAEYIVGDNDGEKTSGFYIMPSLMLSETLQAVVRYEQADSDRSTGLRAASRYARRAEGLAPVEVSEGTTVDPTRGDEYMALYLGLNYYINGDGNKLMFGVEFSELDNTSAGTLEATSVYAAWRTLF